jgi:hypothetical protein
MSDEYIETVSEDILDCMKKSLVKNSLELTFQINEQVKKKTFWLI